MEKLPPQLWCFFSPKLGQKFPRPAMLIILIYKWSKLNKNTNHNPQYIHDKSILENVLTNKQRD